MKQIFSLLIILATTYSFSQEAMHFLFTTEGNYQITDPLCSDMIKEAEEMMNDQMKKIKEAKKSGFLDLKNAQLQDQVNFMLLERIAENPKDYFVPYYPIIFLLDAYSDAYGKNLFASLQEVGIKELVADSYKLLLEHDVARLYPNQIKQIILCLNTIQTYNLKGKEELQLLNLANQLHFQNRLNKVQKSNGPYYPILDLEFGENLLPHSSYELK